MAGKPERVSFCGFSPEIPSWNYMFMLEAMTYKAWVRIPLSSEGLPVVKPDEVQVHAWTNQYDKDNNEGKWHSVELQNIGTEDGHIFQYGWSDIITSNNDFRFTFKLKCPGDKDWTWSHGWQEDGQAHVEPPRHYDKWTQGPDFNNIIGCVNLGNFIAATNAKACGLTHVLNVADNLDMVYPHQEITYLKIPMIDGAANRIDDCKIKQAVDWLKQYDRPPNQLLINCRAGIGRAGSVAVAYVFASNPTLSYEDAYEWVSQKRFVYPHYGLKETLYRLYPRQLNDGIMMTY